MRREVWTQMPKGEGEESTDESSADPSEAGIIPRELFAAWQEKGLEVGGRGENVTPTSPLLHRPPYPREGLEPILHSR